MKVDIQRSLEGVTYADPSTVPQDVRVFLNGVDATDWAWLWVDVERGRGAKYVRPTFENGLVEPMMETVHGQFELRLPEDMAEGPVRDRMTELETEIERCRDEIVRLRAADGLSGVYAADGTEPDVAAYYEVLRWDRNESGGADRFDDLTVTLYARFRPGCWRNPVTAAPVDDLPVQWRGRRYKVVGWEVDTIERSGFSDEQPEPVVPGTVTITLKGEEIT